MTKVNKINSLINVIRFHGIGYLIEKGISKLFKIIIKDYSLITKLFEDKSGIEVGGPSAVFRDNGFIPVYKLVNGLDGCNFSDKTIWEGKLQKGETFHFQDNKKNGIQFISEASDLSLIHNEQYDFLISSNCLEHVANPIKAVKEWQRVVKPGGALLLVLPNKKYCFDHRRPTTLFNHVLDDFNKNTGEADLTHLEEILQLHDLRMDPPAGDLNQFKERSMKNIENRALHHHVFDGKLLKEIFDYLNIETLLQIENREHIILGKKK